jgi:hypothetical protein
MAIDAALGRLGIKPGVCTSSTRPANPFEGQVIYETDTNNTRFWSGSAWESHKGGLISSSAPTGAAAGDIWYDSDDGRAYIYYDDGSSQQWVEFGAPPVQHGKILQVVQAVKTGERFTTTSTSLVDVPDVSVSITPSSTTSKVLVQISGMGGNSTASAHTLLQLVRDATLIGQGTGGTENYTTEILNNDALAGTGFSITYLDSPSTTSATTYKLQVACNTGTAVIGGYAAGSYYSLITTITAMEVAA